MSLWWNESMRLDLNLDESVYHFPMVAELMWQRHRQDRGLTRNRKRL